MIFFYLRANLTGGLMKGQYLCIFIFFNFYIYYNVNVV